jgi:hypothetical protein
MEKRYLKFKHWKTGENIKYELSFSHPSEEPTKLLCPLDKTKIIFSYGEHSKRYFCPNCETEYPTNTDQKEINEYFQKHILKLKEQLTNLDQKRKDISFFLEKAEESTQNNKANLSAKGSSKSLVNLEKYAKLEQEFGFNPKNVRTDGMTDQ